MDSLEGVESKVCNTCGEDVDIHKFRLHTGILASGVIKKYRSNKCTPCVVLYNKSKMTEEKKARYAQTSREKRRVNKTWAVGHKGMVCEHCDNTFHVSAFDFHHKDPSEKEMDVGLMMTRPRDYLIRELDKCILLCANCHRIHHFYEGDIPDEI